MRKNCNYKKKYIKSRREPFYRGRGPANSWPRPPFIMAVIRTNYPNLNINSMTPGQLQILLSLGFQKIEIM